MDLFLLMYAYENLWVEIALGWNNLFFFTLVCSYSQGYFSIHCVFLVPVWLHWWGNDGPWRSLLSSLGATSLWKSISKQWKMSPQLSLIPSLSLSLVLNTNNSIFYFRLWWYFSCLFSFREKSLEMQNCSWAVVAEKGKMLKWKTPIRSVNMYFYRRRNKRMC